MYKIKAADSSDPKRSGGSYEKSDAFLAIGTIIKGSFRVLHEQEDSLLSPNDNLTLYDKPDLNNSILATILLLRPYHHTSIAILMHKTTVASFRVLRKQEHSHL